MQIFQYPTPSSPLPSHVNARLLEHIEGHCSFEQLDFGLQIHANDSIEKQTAHESFVVPARVTVALILEGDLDAALDDNPLVMTARNGATGYLWLNRQPAKLDRWLRVGQRIRKVLVSLPIEQMAVLSSDGENSIKRWLTEDTATFALISWQPNARAIRHAEEILSANGQSVIDKLGNSIAALSLFQQALLQSSDKPTSLTKRSTRDVNRARHIRQYVLEHIEQDLSADSLASQASMSVSTLQRVFKSAYGTTVMEFVRTRRLELARLSLLETGSTVSEAAYQAGYSSSANFSTAFQREFGYPPSACVCVG